jgi:hypothetical protein
MGARPLPEILFGTPGLHIPTWTLISASQIYLKFGYRLKMGDDNVCEYNNGGSTLSRYNIAAFVDGFVADLKFIFWLSYKIVRKLVKSIALLSQSFTW